MRVRARRRRRAPPPARAHSRIHRGTRRGGYSARPADRGGPTTHPPRGAGSRRVSRARARALAAAGRVYSLDIRRSQRTATCSWRVGQDGRLHCNMPQGRHEAPWGARNLYTGGGAGTSIVGPGMKVTKKRKFRDAPWAKTDSVGVEAERAALKGMTVEEYRAQQPIKVVRSTSTRQLPQASPLEDGESGGPLSESGGPLSSRPMTEAASPSTATAGTLNGPGSECTSSSPWIQVTEGQPPNIRHVWWNTLTDEKRPVKLSVPPVPAKRKPASDKVATPEGLESLLRYESSDSDSD